MADIKPTDLVQSQQQHQQSQDTQLDISQQQQQQQQHDPHQSSFSQPSQQTQHNADMNGQLALTLRLLMQGKEVGSIIGKKGDNIKRFREVSGAKINVSDSSCPDRIVTLSGTLDEVYNAFSMICSKFGEQVNNSANVGLTPSSSGINPGGSPSQANVIGGGDDPQTQQNPLADPLFGLPATGLLNNAITKERSLSGKEADLLTMNNNCTTTINNNNINAPNKNIMSNNNLKNGNNNLSGEGTMSSQQLNPNQQHHTTVTMRLIVPASQCGSLIGRGGAKIKELRELTSATIQVAPDVLPNSTERVVTIAGNVISLKSCTYQICKIMVESPPKGYVIPYRPKPTLNPMLLAAASANQAAAAAAYNLPGQFALSTHPGVSRLFGAQSLAPAFNPAAAAAAANLRETAAALSAVTSQTMGSHEIAIPNGLIGCVIGKGGSKINEIRQMSGANIKISNPEEGAKNRTVTINGTPEAIQMAQYLITASCNGGQQGSVLESITKPWMANKTARKFAPY